jgi:hypothetical protein
MFRLARPVCCEHPSAMAKEKQEDQEAIVAQLLEAARKLPPGPERHAALKHVGSLRAKLLAAKQEQPPPAK